MIALPGAELLPFAFLAGAAACANPCGFALLPAYVGYFLSRQDSGVWAGLRAGAGMTGGVLTVFAAGGAALAAAGYALMRAIPLAALAVGVAVTVAGVVQLARPQVSAHLSLRTPMVAPRLLSDRGWLAFFLFGAGYGAASLGCTLPLFLAVAAQALSAGGVSGGILVFAAYGLGMGAVLLALATALAAGKQAAVRVLRGWTQHVRWVGALGMVAAGSYLVFRSAALGALATLLR